MNAEQIREVLSLCSYRDWEFFYDDTLHYVQVRFTWDDPLTKKPTVWAGRKWQLSSHATRSEIVQTLLLAVLTAEEHEARERFHYRGSAIFGPHYHVDRLALLCEQEHALDTRPEIYTMAQLSSEERGRP